MSRTLTWTLTRAEVEQAIKEWIESQGDVVKAVNISTQHRFSDITFIADLEPPKQSNPRPVTEPLGGDPEDEA